MTDAQVPDWIKNIKEQRAQETARAHAAAQQQLLLAKTIKADGPEFWTLLLKELHITMESLGGIGLRGQMTKLEGGEVGQEVTVFNPASLSGRTYTNIFYCAGATAIRCHPEDTPGYRMEFCLNGKNELAVAIGARSPITAAEAAQQIVEKMVKRPNAHQ
jgi:hypothetical protein